jgi:2-keto-3-deoxy-L-rhamnonate aldolase RhmA
MNDSKLHQLLATKPVLLGSAIESGAPAFVEISGRLGFDVVWLDLEHYRHNPSGVSAFCTACSASGAMPLLRIADASRESILPALEAGATFVVIPMVESADTARQIVHHGKFAPLGGRGFNSSTRGMSYGMVPGIEVMRAANRDTYLFPQIETVEGARNCTEIVKVDGIEGALVGPADLSISAGMPLDYENPVFRKLYRSAITDIRDQGKIAATATMHAGLLEEAIDAGVQIIVCASDTSAVREYLKESHSRHTRLAAKVLKTAQA